MESILAILILMLLIIFVIGMINPSLFLRWEASPTRKRFALYWSGVFFPLFILFGIIASTPFSIESIPSENKTTTSAEVSFSGKGSSEAILTINERKVEIIKDAFTIKLPIILGKNEFKIYYDLKGRKIEKIISITRIAAAEEEQQKPISDKANQETELTNSKKENDANSTEKNTSQLKELIGEKKQDNRSCKVEFIKVAEDLSGTQLKRIFKIIGMDFNNPDCDKELEQFGKAEVDSLNGKAIIISFTKENIASFDFNNYKNGNFEKIFSRYAKLPSGSGLERDPFYTGKYYKK